jgi:hypothetical protein
VRFNGIPLFANDAITAVSVAVTAGVGAHGTEVLFASLPNVSTTR